MLQEFGYNDEDYITKFNKGNITGGVMNLLGTTLDLPKSVFMNLSNAIMDMSHGKAPTYYHRMNYREYNDEISRKYGVKSPFDVLDEIKGENASGSLFGGAAETLLEMITDPYFIYSIYGAYRQSAKNTFGTVGYNEALSDGRILDKARANWNRYASEYRGGGSLVDDVAEGAGKVGINVKPNVSNPKMQNIVNDVYKGKGGANTIGNGTTMDAVRNEIKTGLPTNGKFHSIKAQETINRLQRRLRAGDLTPTEIDIANELIKDLQNVLNGK